MLGSRSLLCCVLALSTACGGRREREDHEPVDSPSASPPREVALPTASATVPPAASASVGTPAPLGSAVATPVGYVRVFIDSLVPTDSGAAVLLSPEPEDEDARILAVFIGGTEALSIQLRLRAERYPRPLTHDLLDSSLVAFDAKVREARITKLEGTTFIGALVISRKDGVVELDARPSDAIAMALGCEAPIFVAREVLDRSALSRKELLDGAKARRPGDPTLL